MARARVNVPLPVLGLNTGATGQWIDTRQVPNSKNMEVNRSILRQRPGSLGLGLSLGERVMKLVELEQGLTKSTLRIGLTKTEKLNKTDNTWLDIAHAVLTGTPADKISCAFPNLAGQKILVFSNGVDAPRKWTGTGNTSVLSGAPKYKFSVAYKGYLVILNITDDGLGNSFGQRVEWPDVDNPEDWLTGQAGSNNLLEDGEDITGGGLFGDYVAVHKESSIYLGYLVDTSEVFRFERRPTGAGTVSNDTIFNLPNGNQIFLARDGIHLFNGVTAPLIDSPVMDEIRESMNPEFAYRATAQLVASKDEYHVAVPTGSQEEPETVYKYNYRTGRVWKDERPGLVTFGLYERSDDEEWDGDGQAWNDDPTRWNDTTLEALNKILLMGFSDGMVTRMDSLANDDGEAIDAFFESKDFTAQDLGSDILGQMVEWTETRVWAKGSAVTVAYSTDGGVTWTDIETLTLAADYPGDDAPDFVYFHFVSSRARFRFRNNTVDESFALKQFAPVGMLAEEGN
jgi:hypothetical protein